MKERKRFSLYVSSFSITLVIIANEIFFLGLGPFSVQALGHCPFKRPSGPTLAISKKIMSISCLDTESLLLRLRINVFLFKRMECLMVVLTWPLDARLRKYEFIRFY